MRNRIIGTATIAIALGALIFIIKSGENENEKAHASSAPVSKTESSTSDNKKLQPPPTTPIMTATKTTVETDSPPLREFRLSSQERRPGETDDNYDLRTQFLGKFDKLIRQAELTPEQVPLVLERFADAQEQAELGWETLSEAFDSPEEGRPLGYLDMTKAATSDFLDSLREVLDREQMRRFLHISVIGDPFAFGIYRPLDITREAQQ